MAKYLCHLGPPHLSLKGAYAMGMKHWRIIKESYHYLVLWSRICGFLPFTPLSVSVAWCLIIRNFTFIHYLKAVCIHNLCKIKVSLIFNCIGAAVLVAGTDKHCTKMYSKFLTTLLIQVIIETVSVNGSFLNSLLNCVCCM